MKITVLGSGSAYGTPMIFNDWRKANPGNPKNIRTRASILLEEKGKTILIDAGPDIRTQINNNNVANIDAVFLTHGHYDHIAGIPELPRAAKILGHSIDVFASAETLNEVKTSFGYLFGKHADAEPDSAKLNWRLLPDTGSFEAAGLQFEAMSFPHHSLHSSGFRYGDFAYVTDWQDMPAASKEKLNNLELLLIECNNGTYPENNGHSDLFKIKEHLSTLSPKKVVLTHLSARVDYDELSSLLPENWSAGYDGLRLSL